MKSLESCQYSFAIFDFRRCFVVVNLYQTEHKIVHTVYLKLPFLSCRLSIQEGLFVGTTSSIVQLVDFLDVPQTVENAKVIFWAVSA